MRIGLITSSYPVSPADATNAGVFARALALELTGMGHAVHVLTPRKPEPIVADPGLGLCEFAWPARETDLASTPLRRPGNLIRYGLLCASGMWTAPRYVQLHDLDAMLALWAIPSGLFALAAHHRWGIPYGVWALGSDIWARRKYPFGDAAVRTVLGQAGFCFADGVALADEVAQITGRSCAFVPSVRRLPETANDPPTGLAPGVCNLLYVGRYERNKGPDVLVEAMRRACDAGVGAHLTMFGGGSMEDQLRARVTGYERHIHLGGYADPATVARTMKACDWLVIPSRIESIPLIFSDALAMRLPIIATQVGDMGALMARYGVGISVAPEDPAALAEAIVQAVRAGPDGFRPAVARAAEDFSLARSAAVSAEALARLVGGTP